MMKACHGIIRVPPNPVHSQTPDICKEARLAETGIPPISDREMALRFLAGAAIHFLQAYGAARNTAHCLRMAILVYCRARLSRNSPTVNSPFHQGALAVLKQQIKRAGQLKYSCPKSDASKPGMSSVETNVKTDYKTGPKL